MIGQPRASRTLITQLILALATIGLAFSLSLTYVLGYAPCFYCLIQRGLLAVVFALSLAAVLHIPGEEREGWMLAGVLAFSLAGAAISAYVLLGEAALILSECVICQSPQFLGLSTFVYALILNSVLSVLSIVGILMK